MLNVVVIGAGIAGRAAARDMALESVAVLLVDAHADALFTEGPGIYDMPPSVRPLNAGVFHAERNRIWLDVAGSVEERQFSQLVIATGANPIGSADGAEIAPLASGTLPEARLASLLGCEFHYDETAEWLLVATDAGSLETSIEGVHVIGAARGAPGRGSAERDASLCASRILGKQLLSATAIAEPVRRTWLPDIQAQSLPDHTILCSSCGVTAGAVRSAASNGVDRLDLLGRLIGAAEGECRGQNCTLIIGLVLSDALDRPLRDVLRPPGEFPAIPIPFAHLTTIGQGDLIERPTMRDSGGLR